MGSWRWHWATLSCGHSSTISPRPPHGRGKLLNVRDASASQVTGNVEIQAIKQILGLQHGKVSAASARLAWWQEGGDR